MSTNIRQTSNPLALFLERLFPREDHSRSIVPTKSANISMADLIVLPKNAQLLLAYCLTRDYSEITLLTSDSDVDGLRDAGWLISMPCSTLGILCFKFRPEMWKRLVSISHTFLKRQLLVEVESYRRGKSALYPWNW